MGTTIKAQFDGEEREFEVLGARSKHRPAEINDFGLTGQATHFFDIEGLILPTNHPSTSYGFLRLVRPQYTFGEVVFEETGEHRVPQVGEWFISSFFPNVIYAGQGESTYPKTILRPISLTGEAL